MTFTGVTLYVDGHFKVSFVSNSFCAFHIRTSLDKVLFLLIKVWTLPCSAKAMYCIIDKAHCIEFNF